VIFSDSLVLEAPPSQVWDLLLDVDRFSACVPGVQQVTPVDARTFDGTMLASVGPMSGTFTFRANILEAEPQRTLTARVNGTDSVTRSTVAADLAMALSPVTADRTELSYQATVDVHGRLALLGDMLLRATASVMLREFGVRLRRELAHESLSR
jgi:carbon monoxide dehydrogenase subunit G